MTKMIHFFVCQSDHHRDKHSSLIFFVTYSSSHQKYEYFGEIFHDKLNGTVWHRMECKLQVQKDKECMRIVSSLRILFFQWALGLVTLVCIKMHQPSRRANMRYCLMSILLAHLAVSNSDYFWMRIFLTQNLKIIQLYQLMYFATVVHMTDMNMWYTMYTRLSRTRRKCENRQELPKLCMLM